MYPSEWDEYRISIANVCKAIVPASNGMGVSFIYESAKDVLRWNDLSVKKHISTVMSIGNMLYVDDKTFRDMMVSSSATKAFSADDIDRMAQAQQRIISGNDKSDS